MRVVGGRLRGRKIALSAKGNIRPTADRVRESIFDILEHSFADFSLDSTYVLDLFAGSGALGIEALSRGAAFCLFVESDATARAVIRNNIDSLGLTGNTKLFGRDATNLGAAPNKEAFRLVFLDPPYRKGLSTLALASASGGRWLALGAIVVIEDHRDTKPDLPVDFTQLDERSWGDTRVTFACYRGRLPVNERVR
jgi:16S rRNA (guanine966-N2)-methyltransferase